ncbi:MAG: hypothetical protein KDD45_15810, partial [Bdellovibrionales bacterium]|nr:hypothetical protein [Bdellovibrionales bacterium]
MTSNIFIEYSEIIKDHYIISFVGEQRMEKYYVKSSLPQEWLQSFKYSRRDSISVSHHEKRLIAYFENPKLRKTKHPLLLIVGGVGSGKSSSIMYAMRKANVCKGCPLEKTCDKVYPDRIIVNYLNFTKNLDHNLDTAHELIVDDHVIDKFWLHIIKTLDNSIADSMSMEIELKQFWPWLCKSQGNYVGFYDFFDMHKEEINDSNTFINRLRSLRDKFRNGLSKKDLAYYKLYQITFLREERKVKCNFLLFDNIDTLPPVLQNELVKFSEEAYELLESKSILLVRPLTYMRNQDASDFIEKIDHAKANLKEVFLKRLDRLKEDKELLEKSNLKNLSSLISCLEKAIHLMPNNKIFRKIFIATTGRSIRFGLRNFYNFL